MQHELDLMTPEQRAAAEKMQAAQMEMARASAAWRRLPGVHHPPPPPAPPSDPGTPAS